MKPLSKVAKIFGVGPLGAGLSLLLLALFAGLDRWAGHPTLLDHTAPLNVIGAALVALGLVLHCWSLVTLRRWWFADQLCTRGPFRLVRHPMYAAWITCVCPGVALLLNSWIYLGWAATLQPLWHKLVGREEDIMRAAFGPTYVRYARRTPRFVPRWGRPPEA